MSITLKSRKILSNCWYCGHYVWFQLVYVFVQAKKNEWKNARLADICIGTSAAPTFLPPHYFEVEDAEGYTRSFDLIDGGVAANNPVS